MTKRTDVSVIKVIVTLTEKKETAAWRQRGLKWVLGKIYHVRKNKVKMI